MKRDYLVPFINLGHLLDHLVMLVFPTVVIALALATRPVRRVFRPLVEPRPTWLFADRTLAAREGRRSDPTGSRRPPERAKVRADPRQNG